MIAKTVEIRDRMTFIPALAVKLSPECESDRFLLARAGYGRLPETQGEYIVLWDMQGGEGVATSDPFKWVKGSRTMHVAHDYIVRNFDTMQSGDVVDVEFILGETASPKVSEGAGTWM